MKQLISLVLLLCFSFNSVAESSAVVSPSQCGALKNKRAPFMLILKKDAPIIPGILSCVNAARIDNASVKGIGAIKDPTLAYYDLGKKEYKSHQFSGIYEILGLNGDVSLLKGKRMLHIHTVIGDEAYNAHGGHLMHGIIGVTGEFVITPMGGKAIREFNKETGLNLISPSKSQKG
jgi:hypothetical protein